MTDEDEGHDLPPIDPDIDATKTEPPFQPQ